MRVRPRGEHAAKVEVSDLDSPVLVHQQIGGLEVPVQDGGIVAVQLQHALQGRYVADVIRPQRSGILADCDAHQGASDRRARQGALMSIRPSSAFPTITSVQEECAVIYTCRMSTMTELQVAIATSAV